MRPATVERIVQRGEAISHAGRFPVPEALRASEEWECPETGRPLARVPGIHRLG
jgi:hypothetical protein